MSVKTATVTGAMLSPHIKDTEWQSSGSTLTVSVAHFLALKVA